MTGTSIELFISYSHQDEPFQRELMKFLKPLERDGVVRLWHDSRIEAGQQVDEEIARHLDSADIIVLLVSADFLASEYCYSVEMKRAVARHMATKARVIPIILRHSDWHRAPFGKLKVVPKDGRPVIAWPTMDEAFLDVTREIRRAIDSIVEHKAGSLEAIGELIRPRVASDPEEPISRFEGEWFVESCDSEDGNPELGTRATLKRYQDQYLLRFWDTDYEWKLGGSGNTLLGGGTAQRSVVSILLVLADNGAFIHFSVTGPKTSKQGVLRRRWA